MESFHFSNLHNTLCMYGKPIIAQPPIPLPKHSFSLQPPSTNRKPSLESLSLTKRSTLKQPSLPTQPSSMASSGKQIIFTERSARKSARPRQPEVHPGEQSVQLLGMGFGCMPSLPIISVPFKFLKELNLTSVGLGLESVSFSFRWELVE